MIFIWKWWKYAETGNRKSNISYSYRGLKSQKTPLFYIRNVYRSYGIYQDVRTSSSVAKVPSQFALSVMGREKLSIEILGHVSSNKRKVEMIENGHPWTSTVLHPALF